MKKSSSSELIQRYYNGETNAINILLDKHRRFILGLCINKLRDRELAEDITQETFIKALKYIDKGKYIEKGSFRGWLSVIAKNMIADHYRKAKSLKKSPLSYRPDLYREANLLTALAIEEDIVKKERIELLKKVILKLPEDQLRVIEEHIFKEKTFKEIAEELNIPLNTALGRFRYAKINTLRLLKEFNIKLLT